ncbi:MAG: preprotein translocase subunit YajC [Spirochaetia bacterium]|nr:preprotein translocase subunit YajC [Spirochaetia bacterium]
MEILEFLAQQSAAPTVAQAPAQAAQPGAFSSWGALLPLAILPFMWFFMIRPQRKEEKRKKELLSQIKKGDEVVTSSGMIGTVATIKDETIILNVGDKTRLEFLKSHITSVREVKKAESK